MISISIVGGSSSTVLGLCYGRVKKDLYKSLGIDCSPYKPKKYAAGLGRLAVRGLSSKRINKAATITQPVSRGCQGRQTAANKWINTNKDKSTEQHRLFDIATGKNIYSPSELGPIIKTLIENGANVNAIYMSGHTALHFAVLGGHTHVVRVLCEAGADLNVSDKYGYTALHFAVFGGHTDVVRVLCESGADVNAKSDKGLMALHFAVLEGHTDVVRVLCEAGADVNMELTEGLNAQIRDLLRAVQDNEMKTLSEVPEDLKGLMKIRRIHQVVNAVLNGSSLDSLSGPLSEVLSNMDAKALVVQKIMKRMDHEQLYLLPGFFHKKAQEKESAMDPFRKFTMGNILPYLRRADANSLRVVSTALEALTFKQNPREFLPSLEQLVALIEKQRVATSSGGGASANQ